MSFLDDIFIDQQLHINCRPCLETLILLLLNFTRHVFQNFAFNDGTGSCCNVWVLDELLNL